MRAEEQDGDISSAGVAQDAEPAVGAAPHPHRPVIISIGRGLTNPRCERVYNTDLVAYFREMQPSKEAWWSGNRWTGNYRTQAKFEATSVAMADLDYYDETGRHVVIPDEIRATVDLAVLPGSLLHWTPRGLRGIWVLPRDLADRGEAGCIHLGYGELLRKGLEEGDARGFRTDRSVDDLARMMFTPNAVVNGHPRAFPCVSGHAVALSLERIQAIGAALRDEAPRSAARQTRPHSRSLDVFRAFLENAPRSIEGQDGSAPCFRVACEAIRCGVSSANRFVNLVQEWNSTCVPPWSEKELRHKFESAQKRVRADDGADAARLADDRGAICVSNKQLLDIVEEAWDVVVAANDPPHLFRRGSGLVRVERDGGGGAKLDEVCDASMNGILARATNWTRKTASSTKDARPPKDVVRDMLVNFDDRVPPIAAIIEAPAFTKHGLVATAGYHEATGLYYQGSSLDKEIPLRPLLRELNEARGLILDELLHDFPFQNGSDLAHAAAALVLPFVRPLIDGPTPLHLFEAPSPGSGKGLLVNLVSIIATGRDAEPTPLPRDDDAVGKKITALLRRGTSFVIFDNAAHEINSASLCAAITSDVYQDRILGHSEMVSLPNRATWIVTANNPNLSLEVARRCIRIRIDPKVDRPWQRTGFKHDPIGEWAKTQRSDLVRAVAIMIQSWIAAGSPLGSRTLGSFECWARIMGGILDHNAVPGFLSDAEELYDLADSGTAELRAFVAAWRDSEYGRRPARANDLWKLASDRDLLPDLLGPGEERSQKIRLGRAVKSLRGRVFGDCRIEIVKDCHEKTNLYVLVPND